MIKESWNIKKGEGELDFEGVTPVIPEKNDIGLAEWVSSLTKSSETMLPKSADEVLEMFSDSRSVVLIDECGNPVAHSAVTFIYDEAKMVEVGGVIVDPEKRRKGYGTIAAYMVTLLAKKKYSGWGIMVLCNNASLPIFTKLGGKIVDYSDVDNKISKDAWDACLTCPKYVQTKAAERYCCDTPVLMP